ncbi:MAG: 50S ribosomal protein L9 [Thermodesulfobacteriota bacterium]
MQVILIEDIQALGKEGQIIKAADGYARNFLLPQGKALEATPKNIALWEKKKAEIRARLEREKANAVELSKKIESGLYTIKHKVGKNDKLYGSVTTSDIADCLAARGINIDRKKIQMAEPIKSLGEFSVSIRLYPGVTAIAKVQIVKDE